MNKLPELTIAGMVTGILCCGWPLQTTHVRADDRIKLTDATKRSGISFRHTDGRGGKRYIVEYVSSGMATLDYDGDGLLDLYFLCGGKLRGSRLSDTPTNRLYRNLGKGRFQDVTVEAGVGDPGHGLGVAAADVDNDGDQDLYVNNFGPNVLYLNQGDGTFQRYTGPSDVSCGNRVGAGVGFLDIEGDGDLDLFVANYVAFTYENHVDHVYRGLSTYASPKDYQPEPDALFRNDGDGTFADVSRASGIADSSGTGMGSICTDFDRDGDTDIFVCNDVMANFLYRNDGRGTFMETGILAGVAYDYLGVRQGSMGVDAGDFDRDGFIDLFMTNFQDETPVMYRNSNAGYFEDATVQTGAVVAATPHVTWGVGFADFDNDTDQDLFVASGHLMENVAQAEDTQSYAAKNLLFRNDGRGRFQNVSATAGSGLTPVHVSRGAALADLDNDGDVDAVVLNSNATPTLMLNETQTNNHWLQIRLHGRTSNRDGVGAIVHVQAGRRTLVQEVYAGRGYQSHYGMRLHFGLGEKADTVEVVVRWPGGRSETFGDLRVDQLHQLRQGEH